jgi:ABC-2 type transport system ATP-binding protein
MNAVLQARDLSLPPRLQALSLTLETGQVTGLLGVNGAGKSTALMALAGVLPGMRGSLELMGQELARQRRLRRHIGWLPQQPPLYPDLSVRENLRLFTALHLQSPPAKAHIEQALQRFALEPLQARLAHRLSGGERMRLALACTLSHEPQVLLLDEPTAGLDPLQAEQLRALIQRESAQRAVLIASHLLPDIEHLCQRVLLMDGGRIVADEPLQTPRPLVRMQLQRPPTDAELTDIAGIARIVSRTDKELLIETGADAPADLAETVAARGWGLLAWQPERSDLLARFRALSIGEAP